MRLATNIRSADIEDTSTKAGRLSKIPKLWRWKGEGMLRWEWICWNVTGSTGVLCAHHNLIVCNIILPPPPASLKWHNHEIFDSKFFSWITSSKPLSIQFESFIIFSKIRGDICSARCTNGVLDTGGKGKIFDKKSFCILFWHLCVVK